MYACVFACTYFVDRFASSLRKSTKHHHQFRLVFCVSRSYYLYTLNVISLHIRSFLLYYAPICYVCTRMAPIHRHSPSNVAQDAHSHRQRSWNDSVSQREYSPFVDDAVVVVVAATMTAAAVVVVVVVFVVGVTGFFHFH